MLRSPVSDINLTVSGSESPPRPEDGATTEEWTAYALSGKKDLQGANLRGADLRVVDLTGANLKGAKLENTNLNGANLTDTTF